MSEFVKNIGNLICLMTVSLLSLCGNIVYRNPTDEDYQLEQQMTSGFLAPLAFPGVTVEVSKLFA